MKKFAYTCARTLTMTGLLMFPLLALCACSEQEIMRPEITTPLIPDPGPEGDVGTIKLTDATQSVAFSAGADNINSYRIPSIVTAKDGSLIVVAEGRHTTWKDKSYTNVVVKRSTDNGKTWGAMSNITATANPSGNFAFMDPTPVVDKVSGKIWIFCCRWKKDVNDPVQNRAFVITSTDNGATWSNPEDVTESIIAPGKYSSGFGPGSGFQIAEGRYKNRLIVPTRQFGGTSSSCTTVYSDNNGASWNIGSGITPGGECQMGDIGNNQLTLNIRMAGGRRVSTSKDGGLTWNAPVQDLGLPGISGGCQASVLGMGDGTTLFCGIQGGTATSTYDDRSKLAIYRSLTAAQTWTKNKLIYEKAASYACMSQLNDGRIAIVFEAGSGAGFTKASSRPAGWMRLDVIVLPAETTNRGYWFE